MEGASLTNGKGPSVQDVKEPPAGTSGFEVAADQYHHYKEDVALMAEMGFKTYRFSISWARLLPEGTGRVNEEGVQYYVYYQLTLYSRPSAQLTTASSTTALVRKASLSQVTFKTCSP